MMTTNFSYPQCIATIKGERPRYKLKGELDLDITFRPLIAHGRAIHLNTLNVQNLVRILNLSDSQSGVTP
jgi:hypothetical protein